MEDINLTFINDDGEEVNDLFNSKLKIETFTRFVFNTPYKVFGLTGSWGVGKTSFIKMWEKCIPDAKYIHIDAYKNDYKSDAFLVIYSSIRQFLKDNTKDIDLDRFNKSAKNYFLTISRIAGRTIFPLVIEKVTGVGIVEKVIEQINELTIDKLLESSEDEERALVALKESLKEVIEMVDKAIVIVIDELDRCKPSFALQILEKVKHIFSSQRIKFVLVYNCQVFSNIIEKEYGLGNGKGIVYLRKYIEAEYIYGIKEFNSRWLLSILGSEEEYNDKSIFYTLQNLYNSILKILSVYNFSIRDAERLVAQLKVYKNVSGRMLGLASIDPAVFILFELYRMVDEMEMNKIFEYCMHNEKTGGLMPKKPIFDSLYKLLNGKSEKDTIKPEEVNDMNSIIEIMIMNRRIFSR